MKKITLALGGGGMKGFAHIGVIRQLEKDGYRVAAVAGTSVGGLVGSLYASGFSTEQLEEFSKSLKFPNIFNRAPHDSPSLIGLQGLFKVLKDKLGDKTFEDLKIPFFATAVDINSGREIIIDTGKLLTAARATSAIPGVFPSVSIHNLNLVDGGVLDPVPVSAARWLSSDHPIVAISLSVPSEEWKESEKISVPSYVPIPDFIVSQLEQLRLGQAMKTFVDSTDIMSSMIADLRLRMEKPDVLLRPEVYKYSLVDRVDVDEAIAYGEQVVIEARQQLEEAFSITKRVNRWLRPSYMNGELLSKIESDLAVADEGD
jgi:NTE family protein